MEIDAFGKGEILHRKYLLLSSIMCLSKIIAEVANSMKLKKNRTQILVVDDHPIVRQGLTQLINQEADLMVCGEATNAYQALEMIAALKPDLAIVDVSLKTSKGIELIKNIRGRDASLPILVLSMYDESIYAERILRAGARGYVIKQEAAEMVVTAIRKVIKGEIYLSGITAKNH